MKILVTGCLGQLGRDVVQASRGFGHTYIYTCRNGGDGLVTLDITDADAVERLVCGNDVDVIINCAAYTDVNRAEDEEEAAYAINAEAVRILAGAAAKADALLMHVSTDYVFDGTSGRPYREDDPVSPLGAYARTKAAGEQAVMASGCRYMIFRASWLYGVCGGNFVKTMIDRTASVPVVNVVCDQIGTPTFTRDFADAIFAVLESGRLDCTGIYNYSNEGVCSWYDFAKEICDMTGHLCDVRPCMSSDYPSKVSRPHFSVLDKSLIKKTFGIEIPHWKDSLSFCIARMAEKGLLD